MIILTLIPPFQSLKDLILIQALTSQALQFPPFLLIKIASIHVKGCKKNPEIKLEPKID